MPPTLLKSRRQAQPQSLNALRTLVHLRDYFGFWPSKLRYGAVSLIASVLVNEQGSHLSDRLPRSTYYDEHYRQTAALIRARQPYLIKNIFTGLAVFGFAIGVCASSYLLNLQPSRIIQLTQSVCRLIYNPRSSPRRFLRCSSARCACAAASHP